MANTQGFEVVAELREASLKQLLKAAWKSGGDASDEGVIPEKIDIPGPSVPDPVQLGPYKVKSGHIQIPQEQLDLTMDVPINGLKVKLGTIIHIEIENPPIDAAKLFDITADVHVRTPLGVKNNNEIIADFTTMPADAVSFTITSGDPIGPITNAAIEEFVHKKYQEGQIPHEIDPIPLSFPPFSMKCRVEFYDDLSNAAKKIKVTKPDPATIKIEIPCYLRFYDITGSAFGVSLATPMAVNGIAVMTADYSETDSNISVKISTATVELTNLLPAAGTEGSNYNSNKSILSIAGFDLDSLIKTGFTTGAAGPLKAFGDINVQIPTMKQIEDFAEQAIKNELLRRKMIQIWKVEEVEGTDTTIQNVVPKSLSDCLAICINNEGSGNPGALTNFIPADRDFAIGTSVSKINNAFIKQRNERYPELKDGHSHTFPNKIEGKTVRLNKLGLELHNGHIEINGEVTVVDAIADSIDVDAGFEQKVTLFWDPDGSSPQEIKHKLEGDPDVSMGAAAWILSALIGFLTLGVIGLIIGLIIMAVVESVASQIGGQVAKDESGKLSSLGAWPGTLDKIGNVKASFHNIVIIETTGLVFAGKMVITSTFASTSMDMARSNGPYTTAGNIPVNFNGGADQPFSKAQWALGNGQQQNLRNPSYRYGKSGLYIARIQTQVTQEGGVTTKHYTRVLVKNVVSVVTFKDPKITIYEGEEVELQAVFTDDNWLDKHTAIVDFGDNTAPEKAVLTETNNEPQAAGLATIKHSWCDNGMYTVRISVHDDAGGIGEATMEVEVLNLPPKIIAPKKIAVLRYQPVRLEAIFTDPGSCDSHVATWDTGDGHIRMATIHEKKINDREIGYASASHIYTCIGNYVARVTITDDDGGEDSRPILVCVTELFNGHFEKGFRIKEPDNDLYTNERKLPARVANEWHPFSNQVAVTGDYKNETGRGMIAGDNQNATAQAAYGYFEADEFICRNGQRAQVIGLSGPGLAGIRQSVCVNKNWDYEFTVHYHLPFTESNCKLYIGIDPMGSTDPESLDIQWVMAMPVDEWVHASVRVKAKAERITCFAALLQIRGNAVLYIDKAALFMIQPVYGKPELKEEDDNNNRDKECCPVDAIEKHDFSRLDNFINRKDVTVTHARYEGKRSEGIRFVSEETAPARAFVVRPSKTESSLPLTMMKGATEIGAGLVKGIVKGAMETFLPRWMKRS